MWKTRFLPACKMRSTCLLVEKYNIPCLEFTLFLFFYSIKSALIVFVFYIFLYCRCFNVCNSISLSVTCWLWLCQYSFCFSLPLMIVCLYSIIKFLIYVTRLSSIPYCRISEIAFLEFLKLTKQQSANEKSTKSYPIF